MITIPNQPIVFDNCIKDVCKCGGSKCDRLALQTDGFAFQFTNYQNYYGIGVTPNIDIIELCDGAVIDTMAAGSFVTTEGVVTGKAVWSDYITVDGCYYLRINGVPLQRNGSITTPFGNWTLFSNNADWETAVPSGIQIVGDVGGGNGTLLQEYDDICTLDAGILFAADTTGGGGSSVDVNLFVNGVLVSTTTVNNTATTILYDIPSGTIVSSVTIGCSVAENKVCKISTYSFVNSYASNPICIYEEIHECTKYFEAYSDVNHTDFEFLSSGFRHYLRVNADISDPFYPCEEEIYLSSAGANTLQYSRHEKHYKLSFGRLMESTWDAISSIMMCQNLYIDGERWTKIEGNIEPKFGKINKRLAVGSLTIKKQTENRKL